MPTSWKHLVKPYDTADMSATVPTVFQRLKVSAGLASALLHGVTVGLVFVGNPAFTALTAELWSDDGDGPGKLIATSTTSWTKAQCITLDHAVKWAGFAFNKVHMRAGLNYCVAIRASGYTGADASYIGWRFSFPDPQYQTGLTIQVVKGLSFPFDVILIGSPVA